MITFLKGNLVEREFGYLVIDVNGVGYYVNTTLYTFSQSSSLEEITIYIYHHIWQDGEELYGFYDKTEREVFKKMIGVSGVGPKLACRILQNVEYERFITLVSEGAVDNLSKINGLGKKTSEKLVFELKEKFIESFSGVVVYSEHKPKILETAVMALVSLGYKENQSRKIISNILEKDTDIEVEELIKQGLSEIYG
jgi:Holliday junction DNA helicase RuvA